MSVVNVEANRLSIDRNISIGYALIVSKFGENVKRLREARGWTQERLAEQLGIRQSAVSNLESGERGLPKTPTLFRLANTLECSVEALIEGVDEDYQRAARQRATEAQLEFERQLAAVREERREPPLERYPELVDQQAERLRRSAERAAALKEFSEREQAIEHDAFDSDVEDEHIDVSGHTKEDIPVIAEGEASPQGALFWSNDGTLLSEVEDRITRPYDVADPHAYGLRVRGDSMMRFYKPGDLVVVSPRTPVTDGDEVYVQLLSGERLIKVAHRMNDGFLLESYNQAYPPRFVERTNIGAMHPIVWSKRKPSGIRATITRASQLPPAKPRKQVAAQSPPPSADVRQVAPAEPDDFSQLPNGDPIWVDEPDSSDE